MINEDYLPTGWNISCVGGDWRWCLLVIRFVVWSSSQDTCRDTIGGVPFVDPWIGWHPVVGQWGSFHRIKAFLRYISCAMLSDPGIHRGSPLTPKLNVGGLCHLADYIRFACSRVRRWWVNPSALIHPAGCRSTWSSVEFSVALVDHDSQRIQIPRIDPLITPGVSPWIWDPWHGGWNCEEIAQGEHGDCQPSCVSFGCWEKQPLIPVEQCTSFI